MQIRLWPAALNHPDPRTIEVTEPVVQLDRPFLCLQQLNSGIAPDRYASRSSPALLTDAGTMAEMVCGANPLVLLEGLVFEDLVISHILPRDIRPERARVASGGEGYAMTLALTGGVKDCWQPVRLRSRYEVLQREEARSLSLPFVAIIGFSAIEVTATEEATIRFDQGPGGMVSLPEVTAAHLEQALDTHPEPGLAIRKLVEEVGPLSSMSGATFAVPGGRFGLSPVDASTAAEELCRSWLPEGSVSSCTLFPLIVEPDGPNQDPSPRIALGLKTDDHFESVMAPGVDPDWLQGLVQLISRKLSLTGGLSLTLARTKALLGKRPGTPVEVPALDNLVKLMQEHPEESIVAAGRINEVVTQDIYFNEKLGDGGPVARMVSAIHRSGRFPRTITQSMFYIVNQRNPAAHGALPGETAVPGLSSAGAESVVLALFSVLEWYLEHYKGAGDTIPPP